jgi:hypothetical protein
VCLFHMLVVKHIYISRACPTPIACYSRFFACIFHRNFQVHHVFIFTDNEKINEGTVATHGHSTSNSKIKVHLGVA